MTRRRRPAQRLAFALTGAIVATIGAVALVQLSGYRLDTELIWIIALTGIGVWLLGSALLGGRPSEPELDEA